MDSFPALGVVCGKAAPVLPEHGQKEPCVLKVPEFKLTDTVPNPRDVWRRSSHLPGVGSGSCGAHTNLRLLLLLGLRVHRRLGTATCRWLAREEPVLVPVLVPLRVPVPRGHVQGAQVRAS